MLVDEVPPSSCRHDGGFIVRTPYDTTITKAPSSTARKRVPHSISPPHHDRYLSDPGRQTLAQDIGPFLQQNSTLSQTWLDEIGSFRGGLEGGRFSFQKAQAAGFRGFKETPVHSGEAWLAAHGLRSDLPSSTYAKPFYEGEYTGGYGNHGGPRGTTV